MSNKIDENKPITLPETTITGSPDSDGADKTSATDASDPTAAAPGQRDEIGTYSSHPWDDFVGEDADARPANFVDEAPARESGSIRAGLAASGGGIDFEPSPRQKLEQNALLGDAIQVLQDESVNPEDLVGDDSAWVATEGKLENRFTGKLYPAEKAKLVSAFEDPAELHSFLADKIAERSDVAVGSQEADAIAAEVSAELAQEVSSLAENRITEKVTASADSAELFLEGLEKKGVKHAIAAMVATSDQSSAELQANVRERLGLSQEAAEDLIDGMHGESPAEAVEHFQGWIDEQKDGLAALKDRADTDQMTTAVLTDPIFSQAREEVIAEMSEDYGPGIENAFETVQSQAVAEARLESKVITGAKIATSAGLTVVTAGVGTPVAAAVAVGTTVAGSAPGLMAAQDNVATAHAADLADVSDGQAGEEAEIDRNIAVGQALADAFFGVAPSNVDGPVREGIEAAINSGSTLGLGAFFDWVTH